MIQTKQDYLEYLEADRIANHKKHKKARIFGDYTYKYLNTLRKVEYFLNTNKNKVLLLWYRYKLARIGVKTGIAIPPNTFGKGLMLFHYGSIVVNGSARFGDYCVIQSATNISENVRGGGNECYIAPGAVILENVKIADHVIIGANAVVTKDINEKGIAVAGAPAKKISNHGFYFEK
jgi:serine O-acetyltransferase